MDTVTSNALKAAIAEMRKELRADLDSFRKEVREDIRALNLKLNAHFNQINVEQIRREQIITRCFWGLAIISNLAVFIVVFFFPGFLVAS
jgi:hypothetical protein